MLDAIERQLLQACAGVPRQWLPWRHAEPQRENRSIRHTDAGTRDRPGETALAWLSRATLRREILVEAAQLDQLVGGVRQLDQRVRRGRRVDDDVRIHQDGGRLVGARLCVGRNPYEEDRRCPHAATPMQSSKECHCPTSAGGSSIVSLPSGSAWCGGTVPVAENVGGQSDSRTVCCTSMNPCAVPLAGRIRVSTQLAPSASRWKIEFTSDRRSRLQVHRRRASPLGLQLIGDLLAFVQAAQARPLDRADMNENILAAIVGLNEAVALGGVEPFDGAVGHVDADLLDIKPFLDDAVPPYASSSAHNLLTSGKAAPSVPAEAAEMRTFAGAIVCRPKARIADEKCAREAKSVNPFPGGGQASEPRLNRRSPAPESPSWPPDSTSQRAPTPARG